MDVASENAAISPPSPTLRGDGARTKARKGNRAGEALDITFEHQTPEMHEQADKLLVAYFLSDEELEGFDKLLQSSNQACVGRL